jgi:Epoxide hydrolase N terminus
MASRLGIAGPPARELVAGRSQGVQLATIQELARYWTTDYDRRACEAELNALPQFKTEIDGEDIYFIHVRSRHENALRRQTVTAAWLSAGGNGTVDAGTWPAGSRRPRSVAEGMAGAPPLLVWCPLRAGSARRHGS